MSGGIAMRLCAAVMFAVLVCAAGAALAVDTPRGIEAALVAAQQDKRGITLHVNGQVVVGAVVRIEPGAWVELRNQQHGRIVVRLDRIDAVAMP